MQVVCHECAHVNSVSLPLSSSPLCTECQAELDDPFPIDVDDTTALTFIEKSELPILLNFYSLFCGPCMAMEEDYEDAALSFGLKVQFLKINTDNFLEIAKTYRLAQVPTIIAIKNAQEFERISRTLSRMELEYWAQSLID